MGSILIESFGRDKINARGPVDVDTLLKIGTTSCLRFWDIIGLSKFNNDFELGSFTSHISIKLLYC
jgi:hypothetical protein